MCNIDLEVLKTVFSNHPEVIAAWLFGSAREGQVRQDGDIDIAVLFDVKPDLDTLCSLRFDLQGKCPQAEIDLVPLNNASPILQFEALNGRLLWSADDDRRAEFSSLAAREYEDSMALLSDGLAMSSQVKTHR